MEGIDTVAAKKGIFTIHQALQSVATDTVVWCVNGNIVGLLTSYRGSQVLHNAVGIGVSAFPEKRVTNNVTSITRG